MMTDEKTPTQDEISIQDIETQNAHQDANATPETVSPLETLEAENVKLKDRLMRAVAEMENLRKRTERDVKDARQYAIANFARDMLTATDNLSRALLTMPQEAKEGAEGALKSLIEGVDMTEREMHRLLEKNGVTKLDPKGQKFDPNFHQAMFEVPNSDVPDNSVFEVVQAGYVIGERVLRPAMVGVAKGGPKHSTPSASDQNTDQNSNNSADHASEHIDKSV